MTRCFYAIPNSTAPPATTDDVLTDGLLASHAVEVLEEASKRPEPFFVAVRGLELWPCYWFGAL